VIAVISDIHGNLSALQAVLQDLDRLGPSQVIVAGDLALGGPRPAECVELVRRRGYPAIRGNTDEWLSAAPDAITDAISWASAQLSDADRRYLAGLPFLWRLPHEAGDLVVVHATPWSVSDVVPPDAPEPLFRRVFAETEAAAVACGHIQLEDWQPCQPRFGQGIGYFLDIPGNCSDFHAMTDFRSTVPEGGRALLYLGMNP